MRTRIWNMLVVAALLSTVGMVGCKNGSKAGSGLAEPVAISESVSGNSAALKSIGAWHIETQEAYDALGDANIFPGELNLDKNDLVIVALGEQKTGGYSVAIESIQLVDGELAVTGKATAPGADAVTTQALTYPYSAVLIPNTDADSVVPYID